MGRILVVEDNRDLAFGLRNNLEIEGHVVELVEDGQTGLEVAESKHPDLVILDLMLPGLDGYSTLEQLRQRDRLTPVLVLTARGEETDKVRALRLGADDYVTKPFGLMELLARVEALLRRSGGDPSAGERRLERFGNVVLDPAARTVNRAGQPVSLTRKEFDLLLALVHKRGAVATRDELMQRVWGYASGVVTRTIDTHVAELRRKLEEDPAHPRHILTVRKTGYRLGL